MKLFRAIKAAYLRDTRLIAASIGIVIFGVATLIVAIKAASLPYGDGQLLAGFWVSLAASFLEDMAFFALIGVIGLYLSLQRPDKDIFDSRIKYLFNANGVNDRLRAFLIEKVAPLGIFSTRYKTSIDFMAYDEKLDAIKAVFHVERVLTNMFKDRAFERERQGFNIVTDEVGDPAQLQGVLLAAWTGTGRRDEQFIVEPKEIYGPRHDEEVYINVPPNGEVTFNYRFWIWHKISESYHLDTLRYSQMAEVFVSNRSDVTMTLVDGKTGQERVLTPKATHLYELGEIPSGQREVFKLKEILKMATPGSGA
ncbi:hypothetical protein SAMIE_1014350 [Sphingobium amiense]|uniref:Uncharacterized protein n=1 Tax=Sphingobium amiense TaxID=135719 RepID=A0A494VZU1_9SPHN|nr:hypothetical protein [Sphingobium amiense]BBD97934.1 hypothetical protein SAMIE_1014350 [Sphingobium amiense]